MRFYGTRFSYRLKVAAPSRHRSVAAIISGSAGDRWETADEAARRYWRALATTVIDIARGRDAAEAMLELSRTERAL